MEIEKTELQRLLDEATTRDLIDSYRFQDRLIIVETQQGVRELTRSEARQYLRTLLSETT